MPPSRQDDSRAAEPRPRARRATLRAVAEQAGVSMSTASLVFSGKGPVRASTRERVERAARALGYTGPNPVAASLRTGRSGLVAVVLETPVRRALRDPYAVTVLDGLAASLDDIGVGVLLVTQPGRDVERSVAQLRAASVDAAVFFTCASGPSDVLELLAGRGIPLVGMGSPRDERVVQCDIDNGAAMRLACDHLRELGHSKVAQVTLPLDREPGVVVPAGDVEPVDDPHAWDRFVAVRETFGAGTPTAPTADGDAETGAVAGRALLDVPPRSRPTAVVAHSDMLAIGVVRAAEELGLSVPGDVSVTGVDGIETAWWPRTLTTVVQPGSEKGRRTGELVRDLLAGGERIDSVVLPSSLRVGDTTGPLRPW